jgi:hypothetical protein
MESSGRIEYLITTGYENFILKRLTHHLEYWWTQTGQQVQLLALNIGGLSRLINIGTTSSISDLNIVPNDNAVRF